MKFEKSVLTYADDSGNTHWYSGIYKIVPYQVSSINGGKKFYHAYYIVDGQKSWGDCFKYDDLNRLKAIKYQSLTKAKEACERHQKIHTPTRTIIERARQCLEGRKQKIIREAA